MDNNVIRKRITTVDRTNDFDSVLVNDGSKIRQLTKNQLEKIINTYGVVEEAEGRNIFLKDSAKSPFRGMKLFGKSEQVETTGAQMIPYPYFNGAKTYNGITWTPQEDGSIKVSGTSTDKSVHYFTNSAHEMTAGTYTVSGSDKDITVRIDSTNKETGAWAAGIAISTNGNPVTFTLTEEDVANYTYTIYASIESGHTVNTTLYPMVNSGEAALPFEPYTGLKVSPSPDYPQKIKSVENPMFDIYGKNFLQNTMSIGLVAGITRTMNEDGSIMLDGTATETHGVGIGQIDLTDGEYILSGGTENAPLPIWGRKLPSGEWTQIVTDYGESVTFEADSNIYSRYLVQYHITSGKAFSKQKLYPMVCLAKSEDKTFEIYKEPQGQVLLYTLCGIPVTSGGNYVDDDGQQWICDEIDLERGVLVQRIKERVLNGTESWQKNDEADPTKYLYFLRINDAGATTCMCDKLGMKSSNTLNKSGNSHDFMGILASSAYQVIYLNLNMLMEENTVSGLKSALHENPLTVIYPLSTPIETPLTDEELEEYRALLTNKPNTTILNNAGAHMEVLYSVDLKTYLDDFTGNILGRKMEVTLLANNWTVSDDGYYFTQEIAVPNVTVNSKIDLQPTPEQMIQLLQSEISLFVANNNGTIVVYALNAVPEEDMTFKALRSEVMAI